MIRPTLLRRLAALLIDYALILGWVALVAAAGAVIALATGGYVDWLTWGTVAAEVLGFVVLVLPVGIYLFLCESSSRQATVGKRVLHMRVVAGDGSRPGRGRTLIRTIVKLVPWEIAHFFVWQTADVVSRGGEFPAWLVAGLAVANLLPVVYVLVVALQRERRGPHDLAAGTRVVTP